MLVGRGGTGAPVGIVVAVAADTGRAAAAPAGIVAGAVEGGIGERKEEEGGRWWSPCWRTDAAGAILFIASGRILLLVRSCQGQGGPWRESVLLLLLMR